MDVFVFVRTAGCRTEDRNPMTLTQQYSSQVVDIRDDPIAERVYGPSGRQESDVHGS